MTNKLSEALLKEINFEAKVFEKLSRETQLVTRDSFGTVIRRETIKVTEFKVCKN